MFILLMEHAILYPECIHTKTSTVRCMRWEKKSFVLCCYENETYTPLLFCTMFKQGERVFLLSASRCGISRRMAYVRGVRRWEAVILNYEYSIRCVFPV